MKSFSDLVNLKSEKFLQILLHVIRFEHFLHPTFAVSQAILELTLPNSMIVNILLNEVEILIGSLFQSCWDVRDYYG